VIRVAEGVGGLALVVGLGGTLLSLWGTVQSELEAVDRVRILRAELGAALARAGAESSGYDPELAEHARGLLDELSAVTSELPLSTRAVVTSEVRDVRLAFASLMSRLQSSATLGPVEVTSRAESLARVQDALQNLHDELASARRARIDRSIVLIWALEAAGVLLLMTLTFLGHRFVRAYQRVEGANEALEDRLQRRTRELRAVRVDLETVEEALRRAEERLGEAFAQATEAQRARAEIEARLAVRGARSTDEPVLDPGAPSSSAARGLQPDSTDSEGRRAFAPAGPDRPRAAPEEAGCGTEAGPDAKPGTTPRANAGAEPDPRPEWSRPTGLVRADSTGCTPGGV